MPRLPTRAGDIFRNWKEIMRRPRLRRRMFRRYRFAASLVAIAVVLSIAIDLFWTENLKTEISAKPPVAIAATAVVLPTAPDKGGIPIIAVEAVDEIGTPKTSSASLGQLDNEVRDALAHFDEIQVAATTSRKTKKLSAAAKLAANAGSNYRIGTTVEYNADGSAKIRFRLVDTADDNIVWAQVFDRVPLGDSTAADNIVREVVGMLAQLNGVIQSHDRLKTESLDPRYACLLTAIEGWRKFDPALQLNARKCLEELVAAHPRFALGYAFLAQIYVRDEYLFRHTTADRSVRDRVFEAAQKAVELDPQSARAYAALMRAHAFRHEVAAATAAGLKAIALNPFDPLVAADLGYRLVIFGEVDRGMALMLNNATSSNIRPLWFNFGLCLATYLQGNLKSAAMYCNAMTTHKTVWALMLRAVVAAKTGDLEMAREIRNMLFAKHPDWRDDAPRQIGKVIVARSIVDRLSHDLAAIGGDGAARQTVSDPRGG